jgi:hypothetical protein
MPTQPSTLIVTNPYVSHAVLSPFEAQALLLCAAVLFGIGFLLAEQQTLRRVLRAMDRPFLESRERPARRV